MPAQILHTLFGEDVISKVYTQFHPRFSPVHKKILEGIQRTYRNIFMLGCQGPDIFYHSQMSRPVALEYGTLLHRRGFGDFTAALFEAALPASFKKRNSHPAPYGERTLTSLGVYALGFMTHAFLDRIAHPFIVYKSSVVSPARGEAVRFMQTFPRGTAHAFFERILDVLMLELLRKRPVIAWDQGSLASVCANPPLGLRELLLQTLKLIFPERAREDQKLSQRIDNTLRDCAVFYRFTDRGQTSLRCPISKGKGYSTGRKIPLVYLYPEGIPLSIDYLNLGHQSWYYPTVIGQGYTSSFPEIYQIGVKTAAAALSAIISLYLETGIFPIKEAARILDNSGLSIKDEAGKPCIPTKTEPLPLVDVLIQQDILRNSITGSFLSSGSFHF